MTTIPLLKAAWHGDTSYSIWFPDDWELTLVGGTTIPPLSPQEIRSAIAAPIAAQTLPMLASGRKRVGIIVDDLSRPTPSSFLFTVVLEELTKTGIMPEKVTLFIAGGTHQPATDEEVLKKMGPLPAGIRVCSHDSQSDLDYLGKSTRGTPVFINRAIMACDLKIGIGCIYPHPAAAFSGGSKILIPGLAGYETIRYMHDHLRGAQQRGGELDNEFRREIEEITDLIELDFIVNAVLNQERRIAALFAGDRRQAFRHGVEKAKQLYSFSASQNADIVIADMYPFDANIQFAFDRGMWPLYGTKPGASKVILAACPEGVGSHMLFPVKRPLQTRIIRRLRHFHRRDIGSLPYRLKSAFTLVTQKPKDVWMLSEGIRNDEFRALFPKGTIYRTWENLLADLQAKHPKLPVRVAVYRCAPFLIPD